MNLLQQFVDFLLNQRPKPSLLTVKNYKADIGQFLGWFEKEFNPLGDQAFSFDPSKVTLEILQNYKAIRDLSGSSMERHTSSLRKFFNFLKAQRIITFDLFPPADYKGKIEADPWMLRNFKSFLYEYKKSRLTIKNYINDVKSFFLWLGEAALIKYAWNIADRNLLDKINASVIQEYKQRLIAAKFSPATINRKLSSLRSYMSWAKSQGLISENSEGSENQNVKLPDDQTASPSDSPSPSSIPNENSKFPPVRLIQKSLKGIDLVFDNLFILPLAQIFETAEYLFWKTSGKKIFKKNLILNKVNDPVQNIRREFYAPLSVSARYLPTRKRIWRYIQHVRPNWYKKYHSYSFTHYLHFAILMILSCTVGFGLYNSLFVNIQRQNAILGAAVSVPPRILSFQGKLTDSQGNPITNSADILFSIYSSENTSVKDFFWQEKDFVKPDMEGTFSILLGKKNPISDTLFSQSSTLFLGIKVGDSPELTPRQQIATTSLSSNAQALQGLEPITNTVKVSNVVLALDSGGNLSIAGAKAHTFQTVGAQFVLSGSILSLATTPGSNSNVEIAPDGTGKIDLLKPIQNSSNNNNLFSAGGSVEFDDSVAILATTSAQSAFYINQNSTGPLISASTSGTAKFTLENNGNALFAGNLQINGGNLNSSAATFNLLNSAVTALNIGGAATIINLGLASGILNIKSNIVASKDLTLSSFSSNGGILYTNGSGKILQASSGSSSDCLTGGSTPSFTSCSNIFNQVNRAGIGTAAPLFKLDVQDLQGATAAAQIYNTSTATTAAGLIIKLGNTSASVSASNHFINFETAGIGIVGSVQGNGTGAGITYTTNGIADFAEYLKKDKNQTIDYGSVICLGDNSLVAKCDFANNKILGVASEHPAFLGGENLGNGSVAVGLIGQVETFVSTLNGEIKAGDMLTSSDIPGVAVKTTKAGQIMGKALEDLSIIDESKAVGYYDPDNKEYRSKDNFPDIPIKSDIVRVAKIHTLVNVSWYDPNAYLANSGNLIINSINPNTYSISSPLEQALTNIGAFFEVAAANIKSGLINASEIITNTLIVTSDSIIVNGQSLKDYIVNVVKDSGITKSEIISPVVNTDQLATNIISPLSSPSLIVKLSTPSGSLIVENSSGSAVAKIDDQGNASFSGQLTSNELTTNDATISGTLRAGSIFADSIQGLTNFTDIASYSGQFAYVQGLKAEQAQFNQGLMVFGPTSLADLSIAGRLSVGGTMFFTENSIETLGADMSLQSLRQGGLSIMGGLVYIDTEGNIKIQGNLSIAGNLAVSGDVVASGSGTFAKLNFSLVAPVLAVSATEVVASSSAGIANIAPYQSEITIKNALVTKNSVIYVTPVGTPSAQAPFLMRQIPQEPALSGAEGSFTVGIQSPTNHPLDFNWLIIN